jgi:hypothetical protein
MALDGFTGSQSILASVRRISDDGTSLGSTVGPTGPGELNNAGAGGFFNNPSNTLSTSFAILAGSYYVSLGAAGATSNTYYDLTLSAS